MPDIVDAILIENLSTGGAYANTDTDIQGIHADFHRARIRCQHAGPGIQRLRCQFKAEL
jgi:hypothetical protein